VFSYGIEFPHVEIAICIKKEKQKTKEENRKEKRAEK